MIIGAHVVLYSVNAADDRAFLRDALGFAHVDAGDGWLILRLPPSEVAVHPAETNCSPEFYLLTDDVDAEIARLAARGAACTPVQDAGWGRLTQLTLPSGAQLGLYEPRHARP